MDIKDYIKGKRKGPDANKLERESMNDPFLQDAIDGFDSVQGDHIHAIEELEAGVDRKSKQKPLHLRHFWLGIAASFALLVGIGILFNSVVEDHPIASVPATDSVSVGIEKPAPVLHTGVLEKKDQKSSLQKSTDCVGWKVKAADEDSEELAPVVSAESNVILEDLNVDGKPLVIHSDMMGSISENRNDGRSKSINRVVKGVVLDETGSPMVGAVVQFPGKNKPGTITGVDGRFELPLGSLQTNKLQASYVGYNVKVGTVADDSITFRMEPNNLALNEVVVVGYGTKKQKALTGAVASVKSSPESKSEYGRSQFCRYIDANLNDTLCGKAGYRFKVTFRVDSIGRMSEFVFKNIECEKLENAFIELARKSRLWTKNRNTRPTITFRK